MIGLITIAEIGPTPRGMKAAYNAIQKAAWQADGQHWRDHFREKHFTPEGAAEYRYAKRTVAYEQTKRKRFGHNRPLEFTGESRARTRDARVVATRSEGRVRMNAPALNFVNPRGNARPRLELTTISQAEADVLSAVHAGSLTDSLQRLTTTTRETA